MKKLLVGLCAIFVCTFAIAHTVNWHVGDQIISTTTCDSGDNITPPTAPAKTGYHFKEWILNLYDRNTLNVGYTIDHAGNIVENSAFSYTSLIPVSAGANYIYSGVATTSNTLTRRVHAYDSNGVRLRELGVKQTTATGAYELTVTIPNNAEYVRLTVPTTDTNVVFAKIFL